MPGLLFFLFATPPLCARETQPEESGIRLAWKDNLLHLSKPGIPGGSIEIWYVEAYCRSESAHRPWNKTVIPHQTSQLLASADKSHLVLKSVVEPQVEVRHEIRASTEEVTFEVTFENRGTVWADLFWFQPCIRVGRFTGLSQETYVAKCFIESETGVVHLDQTPPCGVAVYQGGQVFVPRGVDREDVNPRPLSPLIPRSSLIGCVSFDGKWVLATAWEPAQELFQGVITCIHCDPRVGGLDAGQRKTVRGKVYLKEGSLADTIHAAALDFPVE